MPKQNRPLVRDGRLQAKKKRTDRSYLRPNGNGGSVVEDEPGSEADSAPDAPLANGATRMSDAEPTPSEMASEETVSAPVASATTGTPAASTTATASAARSTTGGRLPTTVRAIQQQGVRKRREFDVHALAIRDTQYALHEVRRIFILASAVIITLIVLGLTLR